MRRYIMEWDPEKRRVPLQKILDIFHELGQEEVKCYVLIKPQHKNVIEELKSREGLTFYWEEDLGLRGSIFYSHELMPAWIGVFSIDKLDSVEEFDEILFWDDYYPIGTVVLSKNIMLPYNIRNLYAEVLDGTLRAEFFHAIMLFEGGILTYDVTPDSDYFEPDEGYGIDEFLFKWKELLQRADLFDWSKIINSFEESLVFE